MVDDALPRPVVGKALQALHVACRLVLGGLFLYAGAIKAFDRQAMVLAIDAYDLLPESLIPALAVIVPWLEVVIGVLLLLGLFVRFSAAVGAIVTVGFLIGMAQAKARGLQIDCGCFTSGGAGEGVTWLDLARDVAILAAAVWLAIRPAGPAQLDTVIERRLHDRRTDGYPEEDEERSGQG